MAPGKDTDTFPRPPHSTKYCRPYCSITQIKCQVSIDIAIDLFNNKSRARAIGVLAEKNFEKREEACHEMA